MRNIYRLLAILLLIALVGSVLLYLTKNPALPKTINTPSKEEIAAERKNEQLGCIATLPLEMRLGQKLMAAGFSAYLVNETATFADSSIGGVIIMDETPGTLIADFRGAMPITPFIAVDQEGGTVQRYQQMGSLAGAEAIASSTSVASAREQYLANYRYLKEVGITTNFAPVVDVASRTPSPLPGRMYSSDPEVVIDYAAANIEAAKEAGLTPVMKHFPGLGSASGNTDFTVTTTDPLPDLWQRDFIPYQRLAYLEPDVMVGNMIVPSLTNDQPAVWSPEAVSLLRSLGYKNAVIYSDSLSAEAIPGSIKEAVLKTWLAGIDVAVVVQPTDETTHLTSYFEDIISYAKAAVESKELDTTALDASVLRIFERKQINPCELKKS
jgi:beta-N-acetylhexosaminidase